MVVDASILEKLRQASQNYNNRKKQLTSRVESWHCLTQPDSQTFPSTQTCSTVHASQRTLTRIPNSQWEVPINEMKMSQAVSCARQPSSSTLSFDAYSQTDFTRSSLISSVTVATSPIKKPSLVSATTISPVILMPPGRGAVETQTRHDHPPDTDLQVIKVIDTLSEKVESRFREILAAVSRTGENTKSRNSEIEEDELVYLSFLFEHDATVLKLVDAPTNTKETSCKPQIVANPPVRKRNRKAQPIPLQPVKEDDEVAPISTHTGFTSSLKRARLIA